MKFALVHGERMFVDTMPDIEWRAAHEGHVCAIRNDAINGELKVVGVPY
jgi:hypothetical protein